ncbi:hypothetical protein C7C46_26325 [Streptomyces tateyamensis]|uniref:Uncharacterized protein n=1 Tax=Streptomyces tateyamensis TaxID=565073 RepID=A0A2V4NJF1_9ACTN|nr:hypothetical protein C7C46_26325 [Streptomyces tateyamensis]
MPITPRALSREGPSPGAGTGVPRDLARIAEGLGCDLLMVSDHDGRPAGHRHRHRHRVRFASAACPRRRRTPPAPGA